MMRWTIVLMCAIEIVTGSAMTGDYDVIVVGMGAAGTMAAATLAQAGKRVLALEAQDRVGGRVRTVPFGDGIVELGAEWIHGTENSSVYDLAVRSNVPVLSQGLEFKVYRSDGSEADAQIVNDLVEFSLGVLETPPVEPESVGHFITRRINGYVKTKYPELLNDTDFMENFFMFMDQIINNYEASNSWNDVTTASCYEELGGDQHMSWHTHGYKTLFEILLKQYKNGPGLPSLTLKLNTEVVQIKWPKLSTGPVQVTTKDGTVYKAQSVIVTVSLGVLKERHPTLFSPPLPAEKLRAIESVSFGVVAKVTFRFPATICNSSACLFIWKSADKMALPNTDRWLAFSEGLSVPMACPTCATLWLNGDRAKLELPPQLYLFVSRDVNTAEREFEGHSSLFSPPLPQDKVRIIEGLSIGVVNKIELRFAEAFWPKQSSFYGFIWKAEDRKSVPAVDEWTTQIFGCSSPLSHGRVLTIWTSGDGAKLVETLPDDVVQAKVMGIIRRFMGAAVPNPIDMIRSSWFSNPFTRGSYSYDSPLALGLGLGVARAGLGAALRDAEGAPRVLFAGEASHATHFSTVHGALLTGAREAATILNTHHNVHPTTSSKL